MVMDPGTAIASPPPAEEGVAAARRTQSLTREQIVQLGQHGSPWSFAPLALHALTAAPADAGLRFLLAANLAKLLLRTPALEQIELLAELAPGAADDPQLSALRSAIQQLPPDEISATERIALARSNARALTARGISLNGAQEAWERTTRAERWFRARAGNIVRLTGDAAEPASWRHLSDVRSAAQAFVTQRLSGADLKSGLVLEGVDPPWLLLAVHEATEKTEDGFTPRLRVVQADPAELLDGLACADLGALIADERVMFHVEHAGARAERGDGAGAGLLEDFRGRLDTQFMGPLIGGSTVRTRVRPRVAEVMETAGREQAAEQERLLARVAEMYGGRDRAWWAERYRRALGVTAGSGAGRGAAGAEGGPLRVLIPTYRHSTFVRHSAGDIARALERRGIAARVMMEPDDHTRLNTIAYLRAVVEFEPDLLIVINYPRALLGGAIPEQIPYVCWVQDAMTHLYDEAVGRSFGPLEFLAGHASEEFFERFEYPRERSLRLPVVASEEKFHPEPVPADLLARHECEAAYVSHHSEAPEAMLARLMREANDPAVSRCFAAIGERLPLELANLWQPELRSRIVATVRSAAADVLGAPPDARSESHLMHACALPLADRMIRHEMLAWASAVCERRGWRLRLYGRGWERHPTLARHAHPPLEHGDELRACYQAAAVHLHGSVHWNLHQRVTECVLSGGAALVRLRRDDLQLARAWMLTELAERGRPHCSLLGGERRYSYLAAENWPLARYWLQLQRLGLAEEVTPGLNTQPALIAQARELVRELALKEQTAWLWGDLALTGFRDEAELESRLEALIERPALRRNVSEGMRGRASRSLTYDSALRRIIDFVAASLGNERSMDAA